MLVVEYTSVSIGAASADLFSNIGGSGNLKIKSLWSHVPSRDIRLSFEDGVPDAADYTLKVGDLTLEFPEESSGESSFKWTDVDVDWEDGQTIPVSIVQTSAPEEQEEPAANKPATGAPTISGTAQVDETLTAETSSIADEDGLEGVSYRYQWTRSNGSTYTDIAGETDSAYTLVFADQGKTLKVKVSFTDDADNDETLTSEPTEEVTAAPNRAATGDPAISGTPQVDQTLTASTSAIADQDGLDGVSYNYQWTADDTDIQDATDSTYTPSVSDVGNTIKVKVSFTDDRNNDESRTNAATSAVLATVPGQPQSLTVTAGDDIRELDASWQAPSSNGGTDITGYKVQWKESADSWDTEADVSEATVTGTTHTITGLTGGTEYAVRVIATNSAGDGTASAEAAGTPAGAVSEQTTLGPSSPTISSIAISSDPGEDKLYAIGDTIKVKVTFSADVTVTGKPQLELDIGGNAKPAEYQSTNASSTVFSYTVAGGDSDTDGIAISENKLTLNGGSIKDADDNAANLAHSALAAEAGHKVDGIRPTISSISLGSSTSANHDLYIIGELITVHVRFTEEIFLEGTPHITVDPESGAQTADFSYIILPCPILDGADTATLVRLTPEEDESPQDPYQCFTSETQGMEMVFSYTVKEGDLDEDGLSLAANALNLNGGSLLDVAGNAAVITHEAVADNANYVIDGVPPVITSIEITSDPGEDDTYAAGDTIKFNVTFSEQLEFDILPFPRLRLDMGGRARMAYRYQVERSPLDIEEDETGFIMAYSYTVVNGDNDDNGISFPASPVHALWSGVSDLNQNDAALEYEAIPDNPGHKVATSSAGSGGEASDDTEKTGHLTITGTLKVGETVFADFSNVDDEDGVEYAVSTAYFSWSTEGGGGRLQSRFDARYQIGGSGKGKRLKVSAEFFDDNGNKEYLYSPWTEPIGPRDPSSSAPTGLPTITGTPQVDQTLTANTSSINDGDGLDGVSYTYQWIRSDNGADTDIAGETDSTYTPSPSDVGKTIKVKVSFTDDADNDETLTSEATVAIAATVPPAPQSLTVTSGSQTQELDVSWQAPSSNGGSAVTGYKVQWKESTDSWDTQADVSEATVTGTSHTITSLTGGVEYTVRVIASNTAGDGPASTEAKGTPAAENNAPTGLPTVIGTPQVDQTLTVDTSPINDGDGLDNVSYSYQWVRNDGTDDADIAGETSSTYTLVEADQGQTIRVKVTFTDDAGNDESLTSAATVAALARPNRAAAGLPTISGTPQVEQTLTADTSGISDEDGLTNVSYTYQWIAAGTAISGATGSSYTLSANEQGQTIQVKVTFADDADNEETLTSIATVTVAAAPNRSATGKPTIGGTPQVDQTLTADTSPIDDADGLAKVSYRYQWTAGGTDIDGATGASFTLTTSQQGKTIQVQVTFTDDRGNAESLTSEPTDAVAAKPVPLTATFSNVPDSHSGSGEFTFDLTFSENFPLSYVTLRDHAFTEDDNGPITRAQRRVQGSNQTWTITVEPKGNGAITITLPATTDCNAEGAICTGDGRKLSNSLNFTVSGPGQ